MSLLKENYELDKYRYMSITNTKLCVETFWFRVEITKEVF